MAEDTQTKKSWFVRHKVLTVLLVLLGLGLVNSIMSGGSTPTPSTAPAVKPSAQVAEPEEKPQAVLDLPRILAKRISEMDEVDAACGDGTVAEAETSRRVNCIIGERYNLYFEVGDDGRVTTDGIRFIGHVSKGDSEETVLEAAGVVRNPKGYRMTIKPADPAGQIVLDVMR